MKIYSYLFLFVFLISCRSKETGKPTLFTLLDGEQTGVNFSNNLKEDEQFNIIQYLYFYNGGGVSVGDINNDGLPDIYFVSNQGPDKLYLNKGNMQFEDITDKAGVSGKGNWKTGVSMADVNGDGLLDIYLSVVGNYKTFKGKNQLFINNGNLTFTESAEKYGVDAECFSTQSTFFDYDKDGDLDMFLLCHSVHSPGAYRDTSQRREPDWMSGDKLYRNDGGHFTNMTDMAGIYQGKAGYGLGVAIGDVNGDGYTDIYVSNDFHENDYLYYNNGDGTFTEGITHSIGHTSMFSMGNDMADINNDGRLDIITLDMKPEEEDILKRSSLNDPYDIYEFKLEKGYHHQYPRNCLQLNRGNLDGKMASFSEIGQLAGISNTDWSWSALLADYDNDGWKDLYISNGIYRRPIDMDYLKFINNRTVQTAASDLSMAQKMPSGQAANYAFHNNGDLTFTNIGADWGLNQVGFSNGAAYADLDNDGDLDLIVNNINAQASVYQNNAEKMNSNRFITIKLDGEGGNRFGTGAKVTIYDDGQRFFQEMSATRGFESSGEYALHFGVGKTGTVDSLRIVWPDGRRQVLKSVKTNQTITLKQSEASFLPKLATIATVKVSKRGRASVKEKKKNKGNTIKTNSHIVASSGPEKPFHELTDASMWDYRHKEDLFFDSNQEKLIPHFVSTEGPRLAIGDVNGDGMEDFFVGGAKGQMGYFYIQSKKGLLANAKAIPLKDNIDFEDIDATLFDADGDGDLDLYVISGGNEFKGTNPAMSDRLYVNDGKGNFKRDMKALPTFFHNGSCVKPADFDGDGDLDLFVGSRIVSGQYGIPPRSYLLKNDGKGHFTDVTQEVSPDLADIGMVTDAVWVKMKDQKLPDLFVVGDWMPLTIFRNNGKHFNMQVLQRSGGWWNTIAAADMDNDGDLDFIVGNLGQNTLLKASSTQPVSLYVKDFDGNGSTEPIMTYYRQNKEYVFVSKDELTSQLPSLKKRYLEYEKFSQSSFSEIFPANQLKDAVTLKADQFETVYIENKGNGDLEIHHLPEVVQFAPVESILLGDFDRDGKPDAILGGNFYAMQPSIGRFDASYGVFLKGDGKGHFTALEPTESGLVLKGQIRDLKLFRTKFGGHILLAARNNDALQVFQMRGEK